ncbi:MAG TPA: nitroreductase family protein [Thermomicrobiales bacterium]|nr:nitroreductase family protein [Thermomicrobiales bacterium]
MTDGRSTCLFDVMMGRSSVRSFRTDQIEPDLVVRAIEMAGWAPSPHGTQPWRFVIIERQQDRSRLAEAMADSWRDQLRLDHVDEDVVEHRVSRSRERLERAPVVVILCLTLEDAHQYPDAERQRSEELMAIQSLGAAAQNFLLALHGLGLDAGWMCAPLFCPDLIVRTLGLSASLQPHAMFPVGRMDLPPRRRERRPVEDLIVRPQVGPGDAVE